MAIGICRRRRSGLFGKRGSMRKFAFFWLWCLVFTIPWASIVVLPGVGTIASTIGLIAFSTGVLTLFITGRVRKLSVTYLLILLFFTWGLLSCLWSIVPSVTEQGEFTYVRLLAMTWLIWEFAREKPQQIKLLQAYVLGAFVSLAQLFINYSKQQHLGLGGGRFTIDHYDPNFLGIILTLAIPFAWYLIQHSHSRWTMLMNGGYIPLAIIGILLTASRGATVAAVVALAYIVLTYVHVNRGKKIALFVMILMAFVVGGLLVPAANFQRLGTIGNSVSTGSLDHREYIWQAGMTVFFMHPFLGVGTNAFPDAIEPLYALRVAHNFFLSVLVERGMIGFTLFLVLFIQLLLSTRKMEKSERHLWVIVLLAWAVGGMSLSLDNDKDTWFVWGMVAAQAALSHRQSAQSKKGDEL